LWKKISDIQCYIFHTYRVIMHLSFTISDKILKLVYTLKRIKEIRKLVIFPVRIEYWYLNYQFSEKLFTLN